MRNRKSIQNQTGSYHSLRARLIERGFTLRSFAIRHGYSIPTVYLAAQGHRNGVIAVRIRKHLEELINDN